MTCILRVQNEAATFGDDSFARLSHAPAFPPRQRGFTRLERPVKGTQASQVGGGPSEGVAGGKMTGRGRGSSIPLLASWPRLTRQESLTPPLSEHQDSSIQPHRWRRNGGGVDDGATTNFYTGQTGFGYMVVEKTRGGSTTERHVLFPGPWCPVVSCAQISASGTR